MAPARSRAPPAPTGAHGSCRPSRLTESRQVTQNMQRAAHRILVIAITVLAVHSAGAAAASAATCSIACENAKQGTPQSTWDVNGAGSAGIQGFATDISVNVGQTQSFKVKTNARSYRLDIYRMGYYGGNGARLRGHRDAVGRAAPDPADLPQGHEHQSLRLRQLGRVGLLGRAGGRRVGHLLRQARPDGRHERVEPHLLRRPRGRRAPPTCCSRPPTPPGRPTTTTAAAASTTARSRSGAPTS